VLGQLDKSQQLGKVPNYLKHADKRPHAILKKRGSAFVADDNQTSKVELHKVALCDARMSALGH